MSSPLGIATVDQDGASDVGSTLSNTAVPVAEAHDKEVARNAGGSEDANGTVNELVETLMSKIKDLENKITVMDKEGIRELMEEVLAQHGFEQMRSSKMTQDDFLLLLATFNEKNIHFS